MRKLVILFIFCQFFILVQRGICQDQIPESAHNNHKIIEDNWLGKDKLKHFVASFYCASYAQWFSYYDYGLYRNQSRRAGFVFSMSLGFIKEMYDRERKRIFSWKDLVFDFLGALCGTVLIRW
ncbi:MAG: hypothetical protein R6V04_04590 [bacterium]